MSGKTNPRDPKGNNRSGGGNGGKYERVYSGSMGSTLRWADVDAQAIRDAIDAVTAAGDACLFSLSSDGGVLVLQVFAGADKPKFYAKDATQAEVILSEIENAARA